MKLMFVKSILVIFFGLFLILSSCAKKNSSSQTRAGAPRGDAAAVATAMGVTKCADGSNITGRITETTVGADFRASWVDFFSAVMPADQIGDLSGSSTSTTTGVSFDISMRIVNNQLNLAETKMNIAVRDSFVDQKSSDTGEIITPIKMSFPSAQTGSSVTAIVNGTGSYTLIFGDAYGRITVTGTFNATTSTGTVTFVNTQHHLGETAKSGTLGRFTLNSCGLFN